MATSPAHKFGQIIGELLELALEPHLQKFARKHKLYLDKKGSRAARPGKKVSLEDINGNVHELDFVLERGGDESNIGVPVAFIETAWRRYTKHSRNKAQEIQSAILPLAAKYKRASPFIGVVLAGEFTEGALAQLTSLGFGVLYFPYDSVIKAFAKFGIDARFNEHTTETDFIVKIEQWNKLPNKSEVAKTLLKLNKKGLDEFSSILSRSISRYIEHIVILPLHGHENVSYRIDEAIKFLQTYPEERSNFPFRKYEIIIKYNTGDRIEASFNDKSNGIHFLENYT